jgi:hypothetical protein
MTPREIIRANIECRADERIGLNFGGDDRINDMSGAGLTHERRLETWEEGQFVYSVDMWGNVWHRIKGLSQGGEVCRPVLDDWAKLDALELPALDEPVNFESARGAVAAGSDTFLVGWMPGWPFATCRYMRKMEIYFMDLIAERERIDILHDRVTSLFERVIVQYGEVGVDGIMFCEDLGVQDRLLMGPGMWRDIFRPLYERLTSTAHRYGIKVIQHSCGFNWELVDDLCEAGIDCLQFDQPALYDEPALADKLRKHGVGLFSPCDIQKVLPTGDRALIERETARLVNTFRGGFIAKNYGDLHGIGVEPEWDRWAYETFVREGARESKEGS